MKKFFSNIINLFKKVFKWIIYELRDVKTFIIFMIVWLVMMAPAWGGYLLAIFTDNSWHLTYATAYFFFWAGPFTPFIPLCLTITIGIKKILKIRTNRKIKKDSQGFDNSESK